MHFRQLIPLFALAVNVVSAENTWEVRVWSVGNCDVNSGDGGGATWAFDGSGSRGCSSTAAPDGGFASGSIEFDSSVQGDGAYCKLSIYTEPNCMYSGKGGDFGSF